MKKLLLILLLIASVPCVAQVTQQSETDEALQKANIQQIRELKVVFISQRLNLSPAEKAAFWPMYDQYQADLIAARRDNKTDEIAREEAVLAVKKRYQDQFNNILGRNRTRYFFESEKDFTQMLLTRLHPNRVGPAARMPMQHKGY
jgi:phosphoglycolate phosphatase-like HAD superfamily hydrolase